MCAEKLVPNKRHQVKVGSRYIQIQIELALKGNAEPLAFSFGGGTEGSDIYRPPYDENGVQPSCRPSIQVAQLPREAQAALIQSLFEPSSSFFERFLTILDRSICNTAKVRPFLTRS